MYIYYYIYISFPLSLTLSLYVYIYIHIHTYKPVKAPSQPTFPHLDPLQDPLQMFVPVCPSTGSSAGSRPPFSGWSARSNQSTISKQITDYSLSMYDTHKLSWLITNNFLWLPTERQMQTIGHVAHSFADFRRYHHHFVPSFITWTTLLISLHDCILFQNVQVILSH